MEALAAGRDADITCGTITGLRRLLGVHSYAGCTGKSIHGLAERWLVLRKELDVLSGLALAHCRHGVDAAVTERITSQQCVLPSIRGRTVHTKSLVHVPRLLLCLLPSPALLLLLHQLLLEGSHGNELVEVVLYDAVPEVVEVD